MKTRELPETEYLRIRNYLLSMIFHAGHESILMPSSRELAAQFKVARATVTKALNLLAKEHYLVTRKGVGTFSNPATVKSYGAPVKIAGILLGNGNNLFHEYSGWFALAYAGLELTKHDCFLREVRLVGMENPDRIEMEIRAQHLDALLHIAPPAFFNPILEKLSREGFPVVTLFGQANTRNYGFDFERSGYEIGMCLLKEHRTLFYGMFPICYESFQNGMKRAYREAGQEVRIRTFKHLNDLRDAMRKEVPDALYIMASFDTPILDMLEELKIDFHSKCRLITFRPKILDPRFRGFQHFPPETEIADGIAGDLLTMLNGTRLDPISRNIPLKIKKINLQ